jgi:hypothetical protein
MWKTLGWPVADPNGSLSCSTLFGPAALLVSLTFAFSLVICHPFHLLPSWFGVDLSTGDYRLQAIAKTRD